MVIKLAGWIALCGALIISASCNQPDNKLRDRKTDINAWPKISSPLSSSAAENEKIEILLGSMSLEEKVGQIMQAEIHSLTPEDIKTYHIGSVLNGGDSKPDRNPKAAAKDWLTLADAYYSASMDATDSGAAIPVIWGTDAVHGHGAVLGATIFPHNIGLGATRNPELLRQIGSITAREVRATGIQWVFAPTLAVAQNDRWGRTYESYSENPAIVKQLAGAMIEGLQGSPGTDGFLDSYHVVATAKHFLADGGTLGGDDQGDASIPEKELIDIHNPGYVAAIQSGVQTIMASFSSWNGEKLHGSRYLLTDVLKKRMGFDGFVVGDWNGHGQLPGCTNDFCAAAINAGIDLLMVTKDWKAMIRNTLAQVRAGEIPMDRLDDAVRRIIRVKMRAGLFGRKPSDSAVANQEGVIGNAQHRAVARQAVRESLVLLKNQNAVLPLNPRQTILVTGDGADNIGKQCGGWSMFWQGSQDNNDFPGATSIYDGIQAAMTRAGGLAILSPDGRYDKKPDVAIVVYGEDPYAEGRGDLNTLEFEPVNKTNLALLKSFRNAGIATVSVFVSGRPLWLTQEINTSDAFVAAWLPGSEGTGIADVLIGQADGKPRHDFKGRLSFSWPKTPLQDVLNPHHENYDPLFKPGYGLTYHSGQAGPAILDESAVDVASAAPADIPFYVGRALQPWHVFIRNHQRNQILSGAFASLPDGDVIIRTSDKDIQGDALTLTWKNAQQARIYLTGGQPLDLSRHLADGVLAFDLKVESGDSEYLGLLMQCGKDCERRFPLTRFAKTSSADNWQPVSIRLACLAQESDTFDRISLPFALESRGSGQLSLANIRFLMAEEGGTVVCQD